MYLNFKYLFSIQSERKIGYVYFYSDVSFFFIKSQECLNTLNRDINFSIEFQSRNYIRDIM